MTFVLPDELSWKTVFRELLTSFPTKIGGGAVLVAVVFLLSACKPQPSLPAPEPVVTAPTATPTPSPTVPPAPTPTPVPVLPRKPVEVGKLFNGLTFRTKFVTPSSDELASLERQQEDSYEVEVTVTAKLPRPSVTLEDLAENDPKLPEVLNQMGLLMETARVSPYFEELYANKIRTIRQQLFNLDQVLSRHNFYDCETILELTSPDTGRKALLIQGDMDVNVDGSDGDRNVQVDDSGRFFQPQTSYRWRKTTDRPNPLITRSQALIAEYKAELAGKPTASRKRELQQAIDHHTRTISDLKTFSFLVSAADPTIVVPGFILRDSSNKHSPGIGDYAVVIYNGVVYPTIVGDAGPSSKVGEASVRLCQEINPKSSAISRPVSNIKVAYLIFPGTADPAGPPDLAKWREKCQQYLDEIGGIAPELFEWKDIVPPWPTPTPSPTPSPTPDPAGSASPTASPVLIPMEGGAEVSPGASPGGSPFPASDSPSEPAPAGD